MEKLIPVILAIAVCLGTTAMLGGTGPKTQTREAEEVRLANDGAFRDGLFVGKLAAERGLGMRPPVGRWSTEKDRTSFEAGYRRGYGEFLSME